MSTKLVKNLKLELDDAIKIFEKTTNKRIKNVLNKFFNGEKISEFPCEYERLLYNVYEDVKLLIEDRWVQMEQEDMWYDYEIDACWPLFEKYNSLFF